MKGSQSEMKGRVYRKENSSVQSQDMTGIRKSRANMLFTDCMIAKADTIVTDCIRFLRYSGCTFAIT
jgi:hypothetical protein